MKEATRRRGQFALATALSVVAYHLSALFGVFFLLPLQWVRSRLGEAAFLASSALALGGIAAVQWGLKALMKSPWSSLDGLLLVMPTTLLAGWVAIVLLARTGWRFLYRALFVTGLAGLALFPLAGSLLASEGFMARLQSGFMTIWNEVLKTPGLETSVTGLNGAEFFEVLKQTFLMTFLLVFFLFWMFTGRLAKAVEGRKRAVLKHFQVPAQGTWVLLVLWGLLLAQSLVNRGGGHWDWGFGQYVVLNVAFIALVVHLIAGVGVVEALMARWNWPAAGRIAVRAALILLLLFAQGAGQLVVLVGLPLLSVLELWVNLRTRTQEVGQ